MKLYVRNLSPDTTREEILEAFRAHGKVESVSLPAERMKQGRAGGVHRGYGFVVMRNRIQAAAARAALEGRTLHGLAMAIQVAIPDRTPHYPS